MTYEQALTEYVAARDRFDQWNDRRGPAAEVTAAETRLVHAALQLAAAVARREGR